MMLPQSFRPLHLLPVLLVGPLVILFADHRLLAEKEPSTDPQQLLLSLGLGSIVVYAVIYGFALIVQNMSDEPSVKRHSDNFPLFAELLASRFAYYALFTGRISFVAIFEATCVLILADNLNINIHQHISLFMIALMVVIVIAHIALEVYSQPKPAKGHN